MKCNDVRDRLPALAERALSSQDTEMVHQHLHRCRACAGAWNRHEVLEQQIRSMSEPDVPEHYWDHARRRILEQIVWPATPAASPLRFGRLAIAVAAAAAALFFAVLLVWSGGNEPPKPMAGQPDVAPAPSPIPAPAPVAVPTHEPAPEPVAPSPKPEPEVVQPVRAPEPPAPAPKPPVEEPVVRPEPPLEPAPVPPAPAPEDPVVKPDPVRPTVPEPAPEPKPEPVTPKPPPAVAVVLPGQPGYFAKFAGEQVSIANASTDAALVAALLQASAARVDEIAAATSGDMAVELCDAYASIVGEGLAEAFSSTKFDKAAKAAAVEGLVAQAKKMADIEAAAPAVSFLQRLLEKGARRPSFKTRGGIGVLAMARQTAVIGSARTVDDKLTAVLGSAEHRLTDLVRAIRQGDPATADDLAASVDTLISKGVAGGLRSAWDAGHNVAGAKSKLLRLLTTQQELVARLARSLPADQRARLSALGDVLAATHRRVGAVPDAPNPNVKPSSPTPPPNPSNPGTDVTDPANPDPKTPPPQPDPGFDPNKP